MWLSTLTNSAALCPRRRPFVHTRMWQITSAASDPDPVSSLLDYAHRNKSSFNDVNYATLMSKLGRLAPHQKRALPADSRYTSLLDTLTRAMTATPLPTGFGTQAVANIVHAHARLRQSNPPLFKAVDEHAAWFVGTSEQPQHISIVAWSFAKLGVQAPNLFDAISKRSSFLVDEGRPQEIANTAWAFATLDYPSLPLFSLINEISERNSSTLMEGRPQAVANTAWAFSKLQYNASEFLAAVDDASELLIESGTTQAVSNISLAFAEIGYEPSEFFDCLEKQADEFVLQSGEQVSQRARNQCGDARAQRMRRSFGAASQSIAATRPRIARSEPIDLCDSLANSAFRAGRCARPRAARSELIFRQSTRLPNPNHHSRSPGAHFVQTFAALLRAASPSARYARLPSLTRPALTRRRSAT